MSLTEIMRSARSRLGNEGPGYVLSLLLHGLALALLLVFARRAISVPAAVFHYVPVALVAQSSGPAAEPAQQKAAGNPHRTRKFSEGTPTLRRTPAGIAPNKTREPIDPLEAKLQALAKLRLPGPVADLTGNAGTAETPDSGNQDFSGGAGPYHTRDIVRAQILRRWSLDMSRLGNRDFRIRIRVLLKRDGTVLEADIVDQNRYKTDAAYRWIALSARNAVVLSSPLALPTGLGDRNLDLTLTLDPRDTLQ